MGKQIAATRRLPPQIFAKPRRIAGQQDQIPLCREMLGQRDAKLRRRREMHVSVCQIDWRTP